MKKCLSEMHQFELADPVKYAPPKVQKISDEYSFAVNSSKRSTKCFSKFQHYPVKSGGAKR